MRRRFFTLLSALSLLLFLATVVLWIRSHWMYETVTLHPRNRQMFVTINQVSGRVQLWVYTASPGPAQSGIESVRVDALESMFPPSKSRDMMLHPPSFECHYTDASHSGRLIRFYTLGLPHWLFIVLFASCLALPVNRWFRLGRCARLNRCPICGYDLRATPDRCPECGTVPAPKKEISN
jgi:hypothetical protein